jgi:hypothetical protein
MTDALADSPSGLLAQASALLEGSAYRPVVEAAGLDWPTEAARVFEDPFGIVAVVVFDTWEHLSIAWPDAQATMVDLLSEHISAAQPKAWEGYLVLLTPGSAGPDRQPLEHIRYDVSRLRKFVADAIELEELGAVDRLLAPLLPLSGDSNLEVEPPPALDLVRLELVDRGFDPGAVRAMLEAFEHQTPILDALDQWRRSDATS